MDALRTQKGRDLVAHFEYLTQREGAWSSTETELGEACRLFGLAQIPEKQIISHQNEPPFGPLAMHAVKTENSELSLTAALAILAVEKESASDRLRRALHKELSGIARTLRTARLRGALAEADPMSSGEQTDLDILSRLSVWVWRFSIRAFSDGLRILTLTTGVALGSGFALGILRFLTALITRKTPGLFALLNFDYGALLGGALVFGHLVSGHLLLRPFDDPAGNQRDLDISIDKKAQKFFDDRKLYWFSWIISSLLFSIAYLFITFTAGSLSISGKWMVLILGWFVGLVLSQAVALALGPWPIYCLRLPNHRPAFLLTIGALLLAQAIFVFSNSTQLSLVILWTAASFRADLAYLAKWPLLGYLINAFPNWYIFMALLDAIIVAAIFMYGLLAGFRLACRVYFGLSMKKEVVP